MDEESERGLREAVNPLSVSDERRERERKRDRRLERKIVYERKSVNLL